MQTKNKYLFLLLILILCVVYWQWFLPGPKVANDFPLISQDYLKSMMDLPRAWTDRGGEGLGEYAIFSFWSYPASFIMGTLANLGLGFSILERLIFIIPFLVIGVFGIWKYFEHLGLSVKGRFVSSLFYLTNTYILLVIDGGQLLISLAYAWFPFAALQVEKAINGNRKQKILAGLFTAILGFFDIRFIFVLFLLCLIRFLYGFFNCNFESRISWVKKWLEVGFILLVIFIGLNAFWIITLLQIPVQASVYANLTHISSVTLANIGHSILIISPHWFKNVFGNIPPLRPEFILIPVLVFVAPIIRRKNYFVGFWLIVAVLSIFLSKGTAEPFSSVYPFLFSKIPGFSLFRDSTKFFFLLTLSYAYLIGVTLDFILDKYKHFPKVKAAILSVFVFYLLFLIRPVFLNQMTGTLSLPHFEKEFNEIADILKEDRDFSRAFWIPATSPLTYSDPAHPIVEALRFVEKRPFAQGIKGTYEIFNFLREAPYMGQLFDVAGIGYIAYPHLDPVRANLDADNIKYYDTFWNQLSHLPWLSKVENTKAPILRVNNHQDKFFIAQNTWWVVGSDSIYSESTQSAKLALSNNALIFSEESAGLGKRIDELPNAKIVLNNKTNLDLAASFIDPVNLIFPAKNLYSEPDSSGWWKREAVDLISWRSFLQEKYGIDNQDFDLGGGWAVGEGKRELRIENGKLKTGQILLARVMESSRSGNMKFYQGNQLIGEVKTKITGNTNVRWFEIGRLDSGNELTITSDGDINVVNALAVLDEKDWTGFYQKAEQYKNQGRILDFREENTESRIANVSYKEVNPTKYIVTVSSLKEEALVVFSANFDSLWRLNGSSPVPVYSLLNGFKVDKDGIYEVNFEAQKTLLPGLIISGITLISLLLILVFLKEPKR